MSCSPSNLFVDFSLWSIPGVTDSQQKSYETLSEGEMYDCAMTSVPCESNLTKVLVNSNPTLIFWFDHVVIYGILTLFVVVGIAGNVISIIIFSTNNIVSDSTNNLILALSVSDLINLTSTAVLITSCFLCNVDVAMASTMFSMVFTQVAFITRWTSLLSLDVVTVIAIQRAAAVIFPFTISTIFSRRNTNIIIIAFTILCICTMIPMNCAIYPRWVYHPYFDKVIALGIYFRYGFQYTVNYIAIYYYTRGVFDVALTFTSVFLTIHKLNKQARHRASLKASTSTSETSTQIKSVRETKVIKMSLAICVVTFSIYSIAIMMNGATQVYAEELLRSSFSSVAEFGLLLVTSINSSFNFFLYLKMSEKYRDVFVNIFKCSGTKL